MELEMWKMKAKVVVLVINGALGTGTSKLEKWLQISETISNFSLEEHTSRNN